jgi:hypothetical protein
MTVLRTQISLDRVGGKSEDVVTNTLHWENDDGGILGTNDTENLLPGLMNRITTFYAYCRANIFSSLLTGTGVIKTYNLADLPDIYPIRETPLSLGPSGVAALPAECAAAVSYNAARVSGVAQARLRGRIFLGPIRTEFVNGSGAPADMRLDTAKLQGVLSAFENMATGIAGSFRLVVFSPTTYQATGGNLGQATNDVVRVTMDNAVDIVRSRGSDPTERWQGVIGGQDVGIVPAT